MWNAPGSETVVDPVEPEPAPAKPAPSRAPVAPPPGWLHAIPSREPSGVQRIATHAAAAPMPSPVPPAMPMTPVITYATPAPAALPPGVRPKEAPGKSFSKRMSTVLGTMVFLQKSKSMPAYVYGGGALLLVGLIALGAGYTWMRVDGERRVAELEGLLATADVGGVRTLVPDLPTDARGRAMRFLGERRDAASVSVLSDALQSERAEERIAAAWALGRIGRPAVGASDALASIANDSTDPARTTAVWALIEAGDPRGGPLAVTAMAEGALTQLDEFDSRVLADRLGATGLRSLVVHSALPVRRFALQELGPRCADNGAEADIARALGDASVRDVAMVALAHCGTPSAHGAMRAALESRGIEAERVWSSIRTSVGAPPLAVLLPFMPDRAAALRDVVALHDPRANDVLVAELARPDLTARERLDVAAALARFNDPRLAEAVRPLLEGPTADAAIALLHRAPASASTAELLTELLRSRDNLAPAVMAAMARSGTCTPDATRALLDRSRRSALEGPAMVALARCRDPRAAAWATAFFSREAPARGGAAALAVASSMRLTALAPELAERLTATPDPMLAHVVGQLADDSIRERLIDRLLDPGTRPNHRTAAYIALTHGVPSSARARLLGYVRTGDDSDRASYASMLLGHTGLTASERTELTALLADDAARMTAALALALDPAESAGSLAAALANDEAARTATDRSIRRVEWSIGEADGSRLLQHVRALAPAADRPVSPAWGALVRALGQDPEWPGAASHATRLEWLDAALASSDPAHRRAAAQTLAATNQLGVLLAHRDIAEADAVLTELGN